MDHAYIKGVLLVLILYKLNFDFGFFFFAKSILVVKKKYFPTLFIHIINHSLRYGT